MSKYYITEESNSVCVWNGHTGECVFQISRYTDVYTGYEQAVEKCKQLNKSVVDCLRSIKPCLEK